MRISLQVICIVFVSLNLVAIVKCDEAKAAKQAAPTSRKLPKDPLYITEVDLENLYDQWEEADDEKLPPDELEPHKRPAEHLNLLKDREELMNNPDKLMQASKRGKTVMAFVTIAGNPTKSITEELTQRWQLGLTNNHMRCERYVIAEDRAIFVFHDGALAYDAKDFFVDQPEVSEYSIDQRTWHGKGYPVEYPNAKKEKVNDDGDNQAKSSRRRDEL